MSANLWSQVLERLQAELDSEEFRRWLLPTAYASDSGDQITVWVPTETDRRHLTKSYEDAVYRAIEALGRSGTHVRFVVSGVGDEDDDPDQPA
jgi:chromosomal replication initiation ATPase DnaA